MLKKVVTVIFVFFLAFIIITKYSNNNEFKVIESSPGENTLALWRFNTSKGLDRDIDIVNGHALQSYGDVSIKSVNSLNGFGQAITGFSSLGGIENTTLGSHSTHTIESWVMWPNENVLPKNNNNPQIVVAFLSGSTFGTRLYFQGSALSLDVRSGDNDNQLVHIEKSVDLQSNIWYHVAYSVKQLTQGLEVKVFLSKQGVNKSIPLPIATQWIENFKLRPGWRLRIGQQFGKGNSNFLGAIDEVQYSKEAKTYFNIFDSQYNDISQGENKDIVIKAIENGHRENNQNFVFLSDVKYRDRVISLSNIGVYNAVSLADHIDHDLFSTTDKIFYYFDIDPSEGFNEPYERKVSNARFIIRRKYPGVRLGKQYYSSHDVLSSSVDNDVDFEYDVINPSLFAFNGSPDWEKSAKEIISKAQSYGVQVYPVISPQYFEMNEDEFSSSNYIDDELWRRQLDMCYHHADGVIIKIDSNKKFAEAFSSPKLMQWRSILEKFLMDIKNRNIKSVNND